MRTILILVLLAVAAGGLAACGEGGTSAPADDRTHVVAGFFPLAEAARQVGGDAVDVVDLTPPGTEPHDLELTPRRLDRIEDADVVLVMGDGFQPALEAAAARAGGRTVRVLDALGVDSHDPHVWLDPGLFARLVQVVGSTLHAPAPRVERYRRQLAALDDRFDAALRTCRTRTLVASHDAYGYLASRYRLTQRSLGGRVPEGEPDPGTLADLADLAVRERVTTVFTEPLLPRRAAQTLAREAHAEVATLDPLESDPGTGYVAAMDANLRALVAGLGCSS